MDVTLDASAGEITVGAWAVTLVHDGGRTELQPGARAGLAGAPVTELAARTTAISQPPTPSTSESPRVAADSLRTRPGAKPPRVGPPAASPGALLATARDQVGRGKLTAAEATYRELLGRFPDASESRAALVSLGRVQSERGRHAAALTSFTRYLDGGAGPLGEEAHWGRIEALHALGRADERDRAIEALAAAHPRSVYLAKARALAAR